MPIFVMFCLNIFSAWDSLSHVNLIMCVKQGMFRGRRFIDVKTTASKNELTSHIINWRIFVYIYPRTNSTNL